MTTTSMNDPKTIALDRMRYTKNTFSSSMCYLAILFNALYFVSIYESDAGSFYYQWLIGVSIVYNLLFMLISFLASEGVKNYKLGYGYLLLGLGAGQIARIFILPRMAHAEPYTVRINNQNVATQVMQNGQYYTVIVLLIASAVCCFAAGIVAVKRSRTLAAYNASLEKA